MLGVVRSLLEPGADVEAKDNYGETALQVAAERGHDDVVELLRKHHRIISARFAHCNAIRGNNTRIE
jgi:ankyrin repeat protein